MPPEPRAWPGTAADRAFTFAIYGPGTNKPFIAARSREDRIVCQARRRRRAGLNQARGKLVAHNSAGKLPAKFVPKVKNADKLDGLDSGKFITKAAKHRQLMTGGYTVLGANGHMGGFSEFPSRLPADLAGDRVHFIPAAGATSLACPGPGRAATGHLCVYEAAAGQRTFNSIFNPRTGIIGAHKTGFALFLTATQQSGFSYGTWAVKAPAAGPSRPASPRQAPHPGTPPVG